VSDLSEKKDVSVSLECDPNIYLSTNECLLRSTLQNLLCNAIKFSHRGGVVNLRTIVSKGGCTFVVKDFGCGMKKSSAEILFGEGGVVSTQGTEGEPGSGLGTIFIRDFVLSSKGTIVARSEEGNGLEVTFFIPQQ